MLVVGMARLVDRAGEALRRVCTAIGVASSWYWRGQLVLHFTLSLYSCVCRFLHRIRTETTDKIVLISNYTQTLDLFERLLRSKQYVHSRR